ncbi:MAG TPA: lipoate-protein ligase B, partial [Alphaproteobacteria bacterium]|nr:lipoate-protein ligase B [Alphaproteobacteria bacterium]
MEWRITQGLTEYPGALRWMEARVAQIADGKATECVWLLE